MGGIMKSLQNIYINKDNAILVIVDIENEFCKPGGKRYSEAGARTIPQVISAVRGLMEQCRSGDIPIVYIQSVRTLKEPEFTVFGKAPFLEEGTWAVEIVDELRPRPQDAVIPKYCHDPFHETGLGSLLKKLTPDPTKFYAIVTGGATEVCLYHTVLGFYIRNYWTAVPVDCAYSISESGKQAALEQLSLRSYRSIFFTRSDLIQVTQEAELVSKLPVPGK
jgi:nicotinamidase-related amidase